VDVGCDELVIAVADHPADPAGLWPADFDLAGRLSAVSSLQIVLTDEAHDAGFRERLERQLPGIEERRWPTVPRDPVIQVPGGASGSVYVSRDREEELRDVARRIRADAADGRPSGPIAIVFHRTLPYLYLAQHVLTDARIPYQTFDALPLAVEPYAALLDLALTLARTGGTTDASIDLIQSPLLNVVVDGEPVGPADAMALEHVLNERRVTGAALVYPAEVAAAGASGMRGVDLEGARRAAVALHRFAEELEPYRTATTSSAQVRTVEAFLRRHERAAVSDDVGDRRRRARAAVLSVLMELGRALERHDDRPRSPDALTALIHHAIEKRTFIAQQQQRAGVHLLDAAAAKCGEFDRTFLVGLVESEWSDRPRRSVLYSSALLKALGWPQEADQTQAQQAAFADMLALPRLSVRLSAFQLEGDAMVGVSPLVELARRRPSEEESLSPVGPLFPDERLTSGQRPADMDPGQEAWWTWRHDRPPLSDPAFSGFVGPTAGNAYRVSRVDRYVTCPFKYFAESVLRLPEDRRVTSGLTPLERGTLLHGLFERFYRDWQAQGRGAIEPHTIDEAVELFAGITREALSSLPAADRVLEEMRILGSLVTRGVAERVFELELATRDRVSRRLLEVDLNGEFSFPVSHGLDRRTILIRGKADRIDVLADGSLRVVDYKLGRMPDVDRSVQVAVYAYCARQQLEAREGGHHPVSSAAYLAFGDDRRLESRIGGSGESAEAAVTNRAQMFAAAVARIEAGAFPAQPLSTLECQWCGYAGVCRKEYRVEQDETADTVRD
jgi:RecB family exonuclease